MKIIFLATKQNFSWNSMQEILPQLQRVWGVAAKESDYDFETIDVDSAAPSEYSRSLLESDLIIVSAFNAKIAGFLKVTREMFNIGTPWVFYLHNQATIGNWPLYEFGIGELLKQEDHFIGTCPGDRDLIESLYKNAQFHLIPFCSEEPLSKSYEFKAGISEVVYIGRVSEQKNLHSLISAIALLKDQGKFFNLTLYGGEDHLGSPNMGLKSRAYLARLKEIALKVGVAHQVNFAGFVDRSVLENEISKKECIVCSPSLHSDENFGMALLMALRCKRRLVVTEWGGHLNYIREFPQIVSSCPVYQNGDGPFLKVSELANAIGTASLIEGSKSVDSTFFDEGDVIKKIKQLYKSILSKKSRVGGLEKKQVLEKVLEARLNHRKENPQKVFVDYSDPLAEIFFKGYGARTSKLLYSEPESEKYKVWVQRCKDFVEVDDPHKGVRRLSSSKAKELGYT